MQAAANEEEELKRLIQLWRNQEIHRVEAIGPVVCCLVPLLLPHPIAAASPADGVINYIDISTGIAGLVGTMEQGSKAIRESGALMQVGI